MKKDICFVCQQCGNEFSKWSGKCYSCNAWNSLIETKTQATSSQKRLSSFSKSDVVKLDDIPFRSVNRIDTGMVDLNRVLGGGIIPGMVALIGGDPGIGKSTLLSQVFGHAPNELNILYITGEESIDQVAIRMKRLGANNDNLYVLAETCVEQMMEHINKIKPQIIIIDSIQTIFSEQLSSAPGSVSQIREASSIFIQLAKQQQIALFLVGHVTKEGVLAGPRILEHMVDTVLYFEGDKNNKYRLLRAVKNRFGSVNELGVFAMTDQGLKTVTNPSAIFLAQFDKSKSGNIITAMWEGSRPILIETQALVDQSYLTNPRRVTVGIDNNRLAILLAVLNRHVNVATFDKDVYINVVGGLKITETASDLALILAIYSSITRKAIGNKILVFGEIGLSGEIRPVQNGEERLNEAQKLGFKSAIIPEKNKPKKKIKDFDITTVSSLKDALNVFQSIAISE